MERRFLPGLYDGFEVGQYATTWDGWQNPRQRALKPGRGSRITQADRVAHLVFEATGVYAVMYRPTPGGAHYVVYIGYSINLKRELRDRYKKWEYEALIKRPAAFPFAVNYISRPQQAIAFEMDLIRCYAPPWNRRFWRQGQSG